MRMPVGERHDNDALRTAVTKTIADAAFFPLAPAIRASGARVMQGG